MKNVLDIQSLLDRAQALGQKVDWWNTAMLWALTFAALAAIAVGIATWMVVTRSKQLGDVQEEISLFLRSQVATLEINASTANKDLAGLQKAATDAKTAQQKVEIDLAKQQERAAIAERTLLQLKESLKERTISAQQRQELISALAKGPKGNVEIWWLSGEPDSYGLALQIKEILAASGWPQAPERLAVGGTGEGFFILVHDISKAPLYAGTLQNAFDSVGIPLQGASKPEVPDNLVQLFIGRRKIIQ